MIPSHISEFLSSKYSMILLIKMETPREPTNIKIKGIPALKYSYPKALNNALIKFGCLLISSIAHALFNFLVFSSRFRLDKIGTQNSSFSLLSLTD